MVRIIDFLWTQCRKDHTAMTKLLEDLGKIQGFDKCAALIEKNTHTGYRMKKAAFALLCAMNDEYDKEYDDTKFKFAEFSEDVLEYAKMAKDSEAFDAVTQGVLLDCGFTKDIMRQLNGEKDNVQDDGVIKAIGKLYGKIYNNIEIAEERRLAKENIARARSATDVIIKERDRLSETLVRMKQSSCDRALKDAQAHNDALAERLKRERADTRSAEDLVDLLNIEQQTSKRLQGELTAEQQQSQRLAAKNENYKQHIRNLVKSVKKMTTERDELQTQLTASQAEVTRSTNALRDLRSEIATKDSEIAAKDSEIAAKEARITVLKEVIDLPDVVSDMRMMKAREDLDQLQQEKAAIEADRATLTQEKATLETEAQQKDEDIQTLQGAQQQLQADLAAKQAELVAEQGVNKGLRSQLATAQSDLQAVKDQLIAKTADISTKQSELDKYRDDKTADQSVIDAKEDALNVLKSEKTALESNLSTKSSDFDAQNQKLKDLQKKLDGAKQIVQTKKDAVKKAESKGQDVQSLKAELQGAQALQDKLEEEIDGPISEDQPDGYASGSDSDIPESEEENLSEEVDASKVTFGNKLNYLFDDTSVPVILLMIVTILPAIIALIRAACADPKKVAEWKAKKAADAEQGQSTDVDEADSEKTTEQGDGQTPNIPPAG